MSIERTMIFFREGNDAVVSLNDSYHPLCTLFNRLMNEVYKGKNIKFFNVFFSTEETFLLHPNALKKNIHHYKNVFSYDDIFDLVAFYDLTQEERKYFLWDKLYEIITEVAIKTKTGGLAEAAEYAYHKGLACLLDTNYKLLKEDVVLYSINVEASVWITFDELNMYSKFSLEKNGIIIYEKLIDTTKLGVGFFLVIYKKIEVVDNIVIIKGRKEIDYLPLKIYIEQSIVLNGFQF